MIGIGTDLVEVERLRAVLDRHGDRFAKRVLTLSEFEQAKSRSDMLRFVAKRWAAKEAVAKALGTGIGAQASFQDIEIFNNSLGAPCVRLTGRAAERAALLGGNQVLISLSDERYYVVAFATLSYVSQGST